MHGLKAFGSLVRVSTALFTFLVASCAGQTFDGHLFRNDELAFRVAHIPSDWRRIEVDQALLAYRTDREGATIAVAGRCNKDGDDVPLAALTHHLFLHFTERSVLSQQSIRLDGREALRTELLASLDGVSKHYVVYVLKKDGCVYDFMRISDSNQGGSEDFDDFVGGFRTVSS